MPLVSTSAAPSGERPAFQATVVSRPEQIQKFQTLEASAPAAPGGAPRSSTCEPRVTLQREGDHVSGIRIQCSCGQVIDLACVYQPEAVAPKA